MRATTNLPDDPVLPGLAAIRTSGLAEVCPSLGIADRSVELLLCGYSPGERATIEARVGDRRVAVKIYAGDPTPEAELYEALAAAGLGGDSGARVPPLLAWERDLRVLVIGWLEGPTAHELVKGRRGERAGELAAGWIRRAASLRMRIGPPFGAAHMLERADAWVDTLAAVDATLGTTAAALAWRLARTEPKEDIPRLVHGTLYARHVLDLGDGPGVIDWQRFGQGPVELDAGMFLATIARIGLNHEKLAGEAARAEKAFVAGTRGVLDERALAWHRAAALFLLAARRAEHPERHRAGDWLGLVHALLGEAALIAEAGRRGAAPFDGVISETRRVIASEGRRPMKRLKAVTAVSVITSILATPLTGTTTEDAVKAPPKRRPLKKDMPRRRIQGIAKLQEIAELPDDPALPALREIRVASQAGKFSTLGGRPIEFLVRSYKPGRRVAVEVRAGHGRIAIKAYSSDPALEAELYEALAAAGLADDSAVRVPPLLAYERDLRMVVIGWLEGPTAQELVEREQGKRAGELAARWLHRSASLSLKLGPTFGSARSLQEARKWVARFGAADPRLGTAATAVARLLAQTQPKEGTLRLVHGSLYARHVLDLGDAAGLIDWDCFGQGPLELDAGMFLATISRLKLLHEDIAGEAAQAEKAFLAGSAGLLEERALAWHRAVALLHLAERGSKPTSRRKDDWRRRAQVLLDEAVRLAQVAA